jgi:hypothetical protein
VGGGRGNVASGQYATVGGGYGNSVTAKKGTIAGGGRANDSIAVSANRVTDDWGTIGGGGNNQAGDNAGPTTDKIYATVSGGATNTASGAFSVVAGGQNNAARGSYAFAGGGLDNTAGGDYAVSFGRRAQALHPGSWVWGDSFDGDVISTVPNEFTARASGGVRFFSNSALTAGVTLAPGSGSWSSVSDRNLKDNIQPLAGRQLLDKLLAVSISTWNYKSQDPSIRHAGPMAQDFHAAFGLGEDDKHIAGIDADGVALAAIQTLYRIVLEKEQQIDRLTEQLREMQNVVKELRSK